MSKISDMHTTILLQKVRKDIVWKLYRQGRLRNLDVDRNLSDADTIIDGALSRIAQLENEEKEKS